jgi:hypothetical protein
MSSAALKALYTPTGRSRSSLTYRDLHNSDMKKLVTLLRSYPSPCSSDQETKDYYLGVGYLIHALPSNLRSSPLNIKLPFLSPSPSPSPSAKTSKAKFTKLCSGHHELNQSIIHSIWSSLRFELERGIGKFLYPILFHAGLPAALELKMRQLEPVLQLWQKDFDFTSHTLCGRAPISSPVQYAEADGVFVPKWAYQENECPACMLARLGSDVDVLTALFAGMVGRLPGRIVGRKNEIRSKRMRWVRYWIKKFPEGEERVEEAWDLGCELKRLRKAWKEHQRGKQGEGFYAGGRAKDREGEGKTHAEFENLSLRSGSDAGRIGSDGTGALHSGFAEASSKTESRRSKRESAIPVDISEPFIPPHVTATATASSFRPLQPKPSIDDASSIYSRTTHGQPLYRPQDSSSHLPARAYKPQTRPQPHNYTHHPPSLSTIPSHTSQRPLSHSPRQEPTLYPSLSSIRSQQAQVENCDDYEWDTDCSASLSSYDSTASETITHNYRTHGSLAPAPLHTDTGSKEEEFLVLPKPNGKSMYGYFGHADKGKKEGRKRREGREEFHGYDGYDVSPPSTPVQGQNGPGLGNIVQKGLYGKRNASSNAEARTTKWSDLY